MPGKPTKVTSSEEKLLRKLLGILNHPAKKPQLPGLSDTKAKPITAAAVVKQPPERKCLEQFSTLFHNVRIFSTHLYGNYFGQIFETLLKQRLACTEWVSIAAREDVLGAFICLRILMRDPSYQQEFFKLGGVRVLVQRLQFFTEEDPEGQYTLEILKEMTNICQKLPTDEEKREWLVACGIHKPLVMLLHTTDIVVLHCSLYALIGLSQSEKAKIAIGELNCTEVLLHIIEHYDIPSKKPAANLLKNLCSDINIREQIKVYEGIRICLSLLDSDNIKFLWHLVWVIVQLSEDKDSSEEVRLLGGIPLILSLIHKDRVFHADQNILVMSSDCATKAATDVEIDNKMELLSLKSAACTALTELVLNDTNAQQIVQANGIYLLSSLILQKKTSQTVSSDEGNAIENLQKSALRALRYLFSMERNRQLFKILFPPDVFEMFIDVGHYVHDLNAYKLLAEKINNLSEEQVTLISSNIEATNRRKAPSRTVGSYAILELLGSGAFGSVFKVCKKNGDGTCFAMKEISLTNPNLGKTTSERNKSSGNIIQETKFLKEQLNHPNVVKYIKAFQQTNTLYVIMEYIEGAPLTEHFNSLKEKKDLFSEERIWNIFIQIVLGLRYLHKEKHIIHRDLTPNNVMLGTEDKVTITDLGLARQKLPEASELTSVVGTMLYWCPEILQHLPYGEKADVWAAGCLLYQMATLRPPFYSSNLLHLATKIVDADYEEIPDEMYSKKLIETVRRCITNDPKTRPDIVEVGAIISEVMMQYTDKLRVKEHGLQKKLDRERKRTQKHYHEANRNMQNYHRLFWANQERSDKMSGVYTSAGYHSMKSGGGSDDSDILFDDVEAYKAGTMTESDQDSGLSCAASSEITPPIDANEDLLFKKLEKKNDVSPKRTEDRFSTVNPPPRQLRDKSARRQLELEIPSTKNKAKSAVPSLHSPTLSPDPTKRRTQSSSSVEMIRRGQSSVQPKPRPPSAAATLSISPRKVRQINDPILQILNQLHKIIFITQLPPTFTSNANRRIVEKFKRALFSQQTGFNLKSEIKKVLEGSKEIIDLSFGFGQPSYLSSQNSVVSQANSMQAEVVEGDTHDSGITYEKMQAIVESVLMENGYYDVSPSIKQRPPLGPIGGLNGR
ncbi:serine/threonine-protein kinase Nek10-like [Dendronephthya gigantea]|uniref:serine/threonine-protein kinase Nek10-like n=1 Tax=Dendronephthya gigantea TaxID=151771 RepID=UPI001069BA3C|nr:serine/threonine-protein kinase Nek10-like [Dendronephthya gigantea]